MKASELISLLQACIAEGGDREVVFEVDRGFVEDPAFGSPKGFFRDGRDVLVLTAPETDKPDIVP